MLHARPSRARRGRPLRCPQLRKPSHATSHGATSAAYTQSTAPSTPSAVPSSSLASPSSSHSSPRPPRSSRYAKASRRSYDGLSLLQDASFLLKRTSHYASTDDTVLPAATARTQPGTPHMYIGLLNGQPLRNPDVALTLWPSAAGLTVLVLLTDGVVLLHPRLTLTLNPTPALTLTLT